MANKFHKLKNNDSEFPLIGNVDVYKYDNDFDYTRYDYTQMSLQICTVPWDVGEAHVGNRTVSGIGNVVYFESKEARDAWFNAIPDDECYRFETKFKELHSAMQIDVPIPYDVCAKYNYLKVHYNLFANDASPVEFEDDSGLRDWFWFIREVEFIAPNTTRLHLLDDAFQTWIYDFNVSAMILERGHAPMFNTRADKYLANPIANCADLLTEDINYGEAEIISHTNELILNSGNMYCCIATTALPNANWGSKNDDSWFVPTGAYYTNNGVPSVYVFAINPNDLNTFLANVTNQAPQFKQTVQGVFFASDELININDTSFSFCGVTCYNVSSNRTSLDLSTLNKSQFNYPSVYADIAKLYTFPYAHIEVTDENGNVDVIKIENTNGQLNASVALSIAYPFVNIEAHIIGNGGVGSRVISFKNVTNRSFEINGKWYETLHEWKVPTFAVVLDPANEFDYSTHFDRKQTKVAYTSAYANALDSADTARVNAKNSADTEKTNTDNVASTNKTNADNAAQAEQANANTIAATTRTNADNVSDANKANAYDAANTNKTNTDAELDTNVSNTLATTTANLNNNQSLTTYNNGVYDSKYKGSFNTAALDPANTGFTPLSAWYNFEKVADDADTDWLVIAQSLSASLSNAFAAGVNNIGASFVTGAASGAIAGAAAGLPGAIAGGVVNSTASAISSGVSLSLSMTNDQNMANIQQGQITDKVTHARNLAINQVYANQKYDNEVRTLDTAYRAATTNALNAAADGNADRTRNTGKANSTRLNTTLKGNADRTNITEKAANLASYSTAVGNAANLYNTAITNNANVYNTAITNSANVKNTAYDNANNSYNTAIAIADRNRDTAISAIENAIAQANLRQPFIYGAFADGDNATLKPIALFSNVVTQNAHAIASAGDEFLRYGYMFGRQWSFDGNWNIGKYFTYWKLSDFWVTNLNVPDMYADKLRFFLFGGVTVWRKPEYIGKKSIYENFN